MPDTAVHAVRSNQDLQHKISLGYALLLGTVALLVMALEPGLLRFTPLSPAELTQILTPLVMLSLFIERAIEVFVTAWRQGHRDQLELSYETAESAGVESERLRRDLSSHRDVTRNMALFASVTVGVALSTLGVRSLELLVDADMLAALDHWQRLAFGLLDVMVTGALLAGGADGLHKIAAAFTTFMEQSSKRLRTAPDRTGSLERPPSS